MSKVKEDRILIRDIFDNEIIDREETVKGWVRFVRKSKNFSFVVINDGSTQDSLQIVVDPTLENYEEVTAMRIGFSISASGKLVKSQGKGQNVEMQAKKIEIIGSVPEDYPLQKKATSLEFLREVAHLRPRTNTFAAIMRIRHSMAMATHKFFDERNFYYIHTPIITASDAEGAGDLFKVTTLTHQQMKEADNPETFKNDFFGRPTFLTVSGQLEVECFALSLGRVYTFGPTFRSENSNTPRHLSEFWMIEPEIAFCQLPQLTEYATDYVKYLIEYALKHCSKELEFFAQNYDVDLITRLNHVKDSPFTKITYTQAIDILLEASKKHKFDYPVKWGIDLQTEHERYLAEQHFATPVIVTDYPKSIKAFYMKANDDGKTVRAMDILVPGVGEIIGGSEREDNHDLLKQRCLDMGLPVDNYWWYLELRKFGSVPHAGFGLGFERMIMYLTGMSNIRDVIPFPRTPKNIHF